MHPYFGPAGNDENFASLGYKSSVDMPKYLSEMELSAYEYQCGRGILIKEDTARKIGASAKAYNISMSIHAPYYINPATVEIQKQQSGIDYIIRTLNLASFMGANRIVVHSGSCAKIDRTIALKNAKSMFAAALHEAENLSLSHIHICPETMGKLNQLGDLEETLEICAIDERLIPTIDFGHLNARSHGGLKSKSDFENIFNSIENKLGYDRLKKFHSHFSKIEYTSGGEKRHLTFEDRVFGPEFEFVAELVYKKSLRPTFICESAGTQSIDAKTMLEMYNKVSK